MLKFHKLEIQNFQSYGNNITEIGLDLQKPHLIVGKNYDAIVDGQVDSNGSGKSTILNALCFAAYDETLTKMSKDKLINYINEKNMYVAVVFEKDNMFYRVERFRKHKAKGGDGVKLFAAKTLAEVFHGASKDLDVTLDSIANTNHKIEKIIGLPFAVFARIVVFNSRYESFLSLPSSHASKDNQRQILEELFGYTEISEKAEKLKDIIKVDKQRLAYLTETYNRTLEEIDRQESKIVSIQAMVDKWDEQKLSDMRQIKSEMKDLLKIDFDAESKRISETENAESEIISLLQKKKAISTALSMVAKSKQDIDSWDRSHAEKIESLTKKLQSQELVDVEAIRLYHETVKLLDTQIADIKKSIAVAKSALVALENNVSSINAEIQHLSDSTCPFCKQHFEDSKAILEQKKISSIEIQSQITVKAREIDAFTDTLKQFETQRQLHMATAPSISVKEAEENNSSIDKIRTQLEMEKLATNPHSLIDLDSNEYNEGIVLELEDKISSYKKLVSENSAGRFENMHQLMQASKTLEKLTFKYDDLKTSLNPYDEVLEELTSSKLPKPESKEIDDLASEIDHKDFLLKLLTKKDSFIRKALLNKNLPLLNTRLSYYLSELGLPHKVIFNEDMTATISQYNNLPFENLSAGQAARLNIGLSFAFRDVLEARFGKINFCILDEFLDNGLGNVGVNLATKLVKKITKSNGLSTLVISHKDEVQNFFDSKIEIELRNGFSTVTKGALKSHPPDDE